MRNNQKGRRNLTKAWIIELELGNKDDLALKHEQERIKFRVSDSDTQEKKPESGKTRKQIAKNANTSTGMVAMSEVLKVKAPELWEKAKTGNITISTAYDTLKKEEKREQQEIKKEEQKQIIESVQNETLKDIDTIIEIGWYKVGNQFLYFGSNTDKEFKDKLPKAKFAFADPPYNVGVDKWDFDYKWNLDYLEDFADVVAVTPGGWNAFNFYKETNMNYIWEMFCWITNGMTHGRCGYANVIKTCIFGKVKPKISQDFWKINIDISKTEDTKHRGRKPYDFMIHLIDIFTNENDIIIDVFAGSGTTLLMSEKMNRISYNAEIDKQYCIDIIKRVGTYERI
jgi:16S rRNA G966 N2-methylase RsmD